MPKYTNLGDNFTGSPSDFFDINGNYVSNPEKLGKKTYDEIMASMRKLSDATKDVSKDLEKIGIKWAAITHAVKAVGNVMSAGQLTVLSKIKRDQGFIADAISDQVESYKEMARIVPILGNSIAQMIDRNYRPLIQYLQAFDKIRDATMSSAYSATAGTLGSAISASPYTQSAQQNYLQNMIQSRMIGQEFNARNSQISDLRSRMHAAYGAWQELRGSKYRGFGEETSYAEEAAKTKYQNLAGQYRKMTDPSSENFKSMKALASARDITADLANKQYLKDLAMSMSVGVASPSGFAVGMPSAFNKPNMDSVDYLVQQLKKLEEIRQLLAKEEIKIPGWI